MDVDERVRAAMGEAIRVGDPPFDAVVTHLVDARGKGVRGALVLACAAAVDPRAEPPVALAAGVELLHVATLHHDDVVDGAATRRGRASVNARWGDHVATFAGTYLLARAIELLARGGPAVDAAAARCTAELWAGQTTELVQAHRTDRTVADYWNVVDRKTGSLFALACVCGATSAAGSPDVVAALEGFGRLLGRAFQLADDIADVERSAAELGKPAAADLAAGVYTLPTLIELADRASASPSGDAGLRRLLESRDPGAASAAAALVRSGAGLRGAHAELAACGERAHAQLSRVGAGDVGTLHGLVDDVCGAVVARAG